MPAASDISWSGPSGTFNLRAAAVTCRGGKILLCTVDGLGYWSCLAGEYASASQGRCCAAGELAEELGHQLRVGGLAFVVANIFASDGIQHELGLYYHVDYPSVLDPDDLLTRHCAAGANWAIGSAGWDSQRWPLSGSSPLA